ncbi:MarR family winged helix-turn-helix transcriptional regulator [Nitratireductor pacificus]|uniref:MarR family transcriptional regulator n=1 Tax=Nitratireductor pacificus pht-3B TaxID=391937 RepID=K2LN27_9HYPH|nr:MarR family transcriptional regulator [Nitratireductor pacificus]EKF19139.1 MarR family transcriptional regulator [Nitratireductor pacificus pht-3B]
MSDHDISAMIGRLARIVSHDGHAAGLKPVQWEALRYLARANRFSCTPSALTAYLGTTKGTVSQTLMALERAGFVRKSTDPADRRSVRLELTEAALALLPHDETQRFERAMDAISELERRALRLGLSALLKARITADGGRPFGLCHACRHFRKDARGPGRHLCGLLAEPLDDDDASRICVEQEAA